MNRTLKTEGLRHPQDPYTQERRVGHPASTGGDQGGARRLDNGATRGHAPGETRPELSGFRPRGPKARSRSCHTAELPLLQQL